MCGNGRGVSKPGGPPRTVHSICCCCIGKVVAFRTCDHVHCCVLKSRRWHGGSIFVHAVGHTTICCHLLAYRRYYQYQSAWQLAPGMVAATFIRVLVWGERWWLLFDHAHAGHLDDCVVRLWRMVMACPCFVTSQSFHTHPTPTNVPQPMVAAWVD